MSRSSNNNLRKTKQTLKNVWSPWRISLDELRSKKQNYQPRNKVLVNISNRFRVRKLNSSMNSMDALLCKRKSSSGRSRNLLKRWIWLRTTRKKCRDSKLHPSLNSISKKLSLNRKSNSWKKPSRTQTAERKRSQSNSRIARRISWTRIKSRLLNLRNKSRIRTSLLKNWRNKITSKRLRSLTLRYWWKSKRTNCLMSSISNPKNSKRIMIHRVIFNVNLIFFKRSMIKSALQWSKLKRKNLSWIRRELLRWNHNSRTLRRPLIWQSKTGPKRRLYSNNVSNSLNSNLMKRRRNLRRIELPMNHYLRVCKHKIGSQSLVVKNSSRESMIWKINLLKSARWLRNNIMKPGHA